VSSVSYFIDQANLTEDPIGDQTD